MSETTKHLLQLGLIIMSIFFGNSTKAGAIDTIELNLSGSSFSLSAPRHGSKDFRKEVIGTNFNIWDKDLYADINLFKPIRYVWDNKGSWLQGLRGTLMMAIFIEYPSNQTSSNTFTIENLEEHYLKTIHDRYDEHNSNAIKINQPERIIAIPDKFSAYTSTTGLRWLTYKLEGSTNRREYIAPLGEKHIVRVSFEIMPTGTGRETGWLEEVERDIDNIMKTTQLQ